MTAQNAQLSFGFTITISTQKLLKNSSVTLNLSMYLSMSSSKVITYSPLKSYKMQDHNNDLIQLYLVK